MNSPRSYLFTLFALLVFAACTEHDLRAPSNVTKKSDFSITIDGSIMYYNVFIVSDASGNVIEMDTVKHLPQTFDVKLPQYSKGDLYTLTMVVWKQHLNDTRAYYIQSWAGLAPADLSFTGLFDSPYIEGPVRQAVIHDAPDGYRFGSFGSAQTTSTVWRSGSDVNINTFIDAAQAVDLFYYGYDAAGQNMRYWLHRDSQDEFELSYDTMSVTENSQMLHIGLMDSVYYQFTGRNVLLEENADLLRVGVKNPAAEFQVNYPNMSFKSFTITGLNKTGVNAMSSFNSLPAEWRTVNASLDGFTLVDGNFFYVPIGSFDFLTAISGDDDVELFDKDFFSWKVNAPQFLPSDYKLQLPQVVLNQYPKLAAHTFAFNSVTLNDYLEFDGYQECMEKVDQYKTAGTPFVLLTKKL